MLECTKFYNHEDVNQILGHAYDMEVHIFSPTALGVPSQRWRTYMIFMKKDGRLKWQAGRPGFLQVFGRQVARDGHVYMEATPKSKVREAVEAYAAKRHMPTRDAAGKRWCGYELMPVGEKRRLQAYRDKVKEQGMKRTEKLLYDTTQELGFGGIYVAYHCVYHSSDGLAPSP